MGLGPWTRRRSWPRLQSPCACSPLLGRSRCGIRLQSSAAQGLVSKGLCAWWPLPAGQNFLPGPGCQPRRRAQTAVLGMVLTSCAHTLSWNCITGIMQAPLHRWRHFHRRAQKAAWSAGHSSATAVLCCQPQSSLQSPPASLALHQQDLRTSAVCMRLHGDAAGSSLNHHMQQM